MSDKVRATYHPDEAPPIVYTCAYCESRYTSFSAYLACETACVNDRGRE
ncbi:MAG: hypothetical protein ABWY57_15950 [Mycetocola sp.]